MTNLFVSAVRQLRSDTKGVTALEYGLIASLIGVAIITAVSTLGTSLSGIFVSIAGSV